MKHNVKELRQQIRQDDIKHDPWGTSQQWRFGIARVLHAQDPSLVPSDWEYRPGAISGAVTFDELVESAEGDNAETPDVDIAVMVDSGEVDNEALIYWGNVLDRFSAMCVRHGKDY